MPDIRIIGWTYLFYLIPSAVGVLLMFILGRKWLRIFKLELLSVLSVPYIAWVVSLQIIGEGDLRNAIEPFLLGLLVVVSSVVRLILGRRYNQKFVAVTSILMLCIAAILLRVFVRFEGPE